MTPDTTPKRKARRLERNKRLEKKNKPNRTWKKMMESQSVCLLFLSSICLSLIVSFRRISVVPCHPSSFSLLHVLVIFSFSCFSSSFLFLQVSLPPLFLPPPLLLRLLVFGARTQPNKTHKKQRNEPPLKTKTAKRKLDASGDWDVLNAFLMAKNQGPPKETNDKQRDKTT